MGCAKEIVNYLHTINGLAILVVKLKQFLNRKKTIFLSYNSTAPWMQKAITFTAFGRLDLEAGAGVV